MVREPVQVCCVPHRPNSCKTSIYAPLKVERQEIRVAKILPAKAFDSSIRCYLETISLQDNPQFEALSWFWGDPDDCLSITLQMQSWDVPANLSRALRRLRDKEKTRTVWIDAFCINQADLDERTSQIGLMGRIYSKADIVHVWLGGSTPSEDARVFQDVALLAHGDGIFDVFAEDLETIRQHSEQVEDSRLWLGGLFDWDWWERLWVLQEVALARSVQVHRGAEVMDLSQFMEAYDAVTVEMRSTYREAAYHFGEKNLQFFLNALDRNLGAIRYFQNTVARIRKHDHESKDQQWIFMTLAGVLVKCRHRHASDWRDKVYGLLGLFPDRVGQALQPSYIEPIKETWVRTAYRILQHSRSFTLFSHGGLINNEDDIGVDLDIPSWVPQWVSSEYYYDDVELRVSQQHLFNACSDKGFNLSPPQGKRLILQALKADKISFCNHPNRDPYDPVDIMFRLDTWLEQSVEHGPYQDEDEQYRNEQTLREAMLRTILNDCVPAVDEPGLIRAQWMDIVAISDWADRVRDDFDTEEETGEDLSQAKFSRQATMSVFQYLRAVLLNKAFFVTELGYIGLANNQLDTMMAEEIRNRGRSDIFDVFVLGGGSHPVILRPVDDKPRTYTVVSEAYVHGIMDGEAVRDLHPEDEGWLDIFIE